MKILVISDTHGDISGVIKILKVVKNISRIIHLGDFEKDAEELAYTQPYPVDYVPGNCDYNSKSDKEKIITVMSKKILITHGHSYNVKWEYDTIKRYAKIKEANIVLFGHSHIPYIEEKEGLLIMNPGSVSQPRGQNKASYGILELLETGHEISIKYL